MSTLGEIDGPALGAEIVQRVAEHIARLGFHLAPGITVHVGESVGDSDLGLTVAQLVTWAQTGDGGDWGATGSVDAAACARDALQTVCASLYSHAAVGKGWSIPPLQVASNGDGGVDVLIRAAWARSAIDLGEPVPRQCLADLAGVDLRTIKRAIAAGDTKVTRGKRGQARGVPARPIPADEARRYLASRVVGEGDASTLAKLGAHCTWQVGPDGPRLRIARGEVPLAALATEREWDAYCDRAGKIRGWVASRAT